MSTNLTVDDLINQCAAKANPEVSQLEQPSKTEQQSTIDPVFMQLHYTGRVSPANGLSISSF